MSEYETRALDASATRSLFEEVGFSNERPKGKKNCVMRTAVSPVDAS
jgi:hypothetical protein